MAIVIMILIKLCQGWKLFAFNRPPLNPFNSKESKHSFLIFTIVTYFNKSKSAQVSETV